MLPDRYFDWHKFHADEHTGPIVVDSRRRLAVFLVGFVGLLLLVFGRVVQLEVSQGAAFRSAAAKPLVRRLSLPGVRGRILACNGTVLACDKKVLALAVHYRYLQEPADPRWLRWTARSRLPAAQRKDPRRLEAEQTRLLAEREELARRLARLSGLSVEQWNARARRVQTRVERIAESVNRRRQAEFDRRRADASRAEPRQAGRPESLTRRIGSVVLDVLRGSMDESPPERITVAEELDYHVMVEDLPLALVAEIEAHPDRYPGVKILQGRRRAYTAGRLAAHVLGHVGPVEEGELRGGGSDGAYHPADFVGRMGLERQYEQLLRGRRGVAVELTDRSGRVLSTYRQREPGIGRDLVLTLDVSLQRSAEELLESALKRLAIRGPGATSAGGAIVVMDVHNGAVLAAASAPAFDPNVFCGDERAAARSLLSDPDHPLFDRVAKMAIPPGSIFKTVAAVALLESSTVVPGEAFFCQGYLHAPDRWRCAIYRRRGTGHGEVTLADALGQSCNVYFFHHAGKLGPEPLVDWGRRFGFGRLTGVDLPGEAAGTLPSPETIAEVEGHAWRAGDTLALAIGQGSFQATPLQVVRMMAAVANGGQLVTPHVVSGLGLPELDDRQSTADLDALARDPIRIRPPQPIAGLKASTLAAVREGLERVVADPRGTGHGTVYLETIPVAGKTGTAETGTAEGDHAWFAGYVPADRPKLAFVVALEHAGNADETAGPVAKRLVLAIEQLGYFDRQPHRLASRAPPGAAGGSGK